MCSILPRKVYDEIRSKFPKPTAPTVNIHIYVNPVKVDAEAVRRIVQKHERSIIQHLRRSAFVLLFAALLPIAAHAQDGSPQPPLSKKQFVFANAANFGASVFNARASWYGAHQCVAREELTRNPRGKFIRTAEISFPIDTVVAIASWKLRKHHRMWSMSLPLISAGAQTSMAATQFSAGCF
jgi:hypothetical protein